MWTVIKIQKNNIEILKNTFLKKLGKETKFYIPKVKMQFYKNNSLTFKELNLLGDYIFCYNQKLEDKNVIQSLSFIKGLKYFLIGSNISQKEIAYFIDRCKNFEDDKGFIKQSLFELKINQFYKFYNGPFSQRIFKLLELQVNKMKILIGNIETTIKKKNLSVVPV